MNPERARQLAHRVPEPALHEVAPGCAKRREIRFTKMPPEQALRALDLLSGLECLEVSPGPHPRGITVAYDLVDYTYEGLEKALRKLGYHLDNSLYCKIVRALVRFTEETQLRNLKEPARLIKQSNQVYIRAWEHHPHGDRDDTPAEVREDR
ncbi:MAG: hypothetical protein EFKGCFLK_01188 [Rhodocyclaceae bacterium]|nr:MAG: hypothetical protein F9K21_06565 [Rhodocyclaceae bacterium]MBE7424003.1 hypothetical protein [Zoogloeaceae bacterium]MBV6407621.1 hypothetical protein [Rhodocyclaceae bacterium]MCK6383320.1 hypothetical protein [Rhodocyclaceae bacterium]CAG0930216.1 hypothetical protein RHDC3_01439 [Rhodocyclaceae bacterium]